MVVHHRLENALARAEELVAVGNQSAALQLLHDAIVSRWFSHNMAALEPIMLKFVELCVELRRGRLAKDGLHQYRSLAIGNNLAGLERVMLRLVDLAEEKLEKARQESATIAATSGEGPSLVEDIEVAPEETLAQLWNVSGVGSLPVGPTTETDRMGRILITPWLRFLWEVFRVILELCRHNAKLEPLYRTVVERAFVFCCQWKRRAEFRRLCEILRHHLAIIIKYPNQVNGIQLQSNPESHALQLELRFRQLDVATEMELWHEAFRSIEDIHGLFVLARKSAMPSLVLTYYSRLAYVFRQSNRPIFLAAALCKLFSLKQKAGWGVADKENIQENGTGADAKGEDLSLDATRAVLALLATPLLGERDVTCTMNEEEMEAKEERLATLLGLTTIPTIDYVHRELKTRGLLSRAHPTAKKLLEMLFETEDGDVDEFALPKKDQLAPLLVELEQNPEFRPFILPIYNNFVVKVLTTLSPRGNIMQEEKGLDTLEATVYLNDVFELISMPEVVSTQKFNMDRLIWEGVNTGDFYMRVEEGPKDTKIVFQRPCFAPAPVLEIPDYPNSREARLSDMLAKLIPPEMTIDDVKGLLDEAIRQVTIDQQVQQERRAKLDRRREQQEREDARERALRQQAEQEAEARRLAEEAARREQLRREAEMETIRREQAAKREEEEQRRREQQLRRANLEKMIAVVRRRDFLERALRQEETPLLYSDYERQKEQDRAAYEERIRLIRDRARSQHTAELQLRESLLGMVDEQEAYLKNRQQRKATAQESYRQQLEEQMEEAKRAHREKTLKEARERTEQQKTQEESRKVSLDGAFKEEGETAAKKYIPPHLKHAVATATKIAVEGSAESEALRQSPFGSKAGGGSWRRAQ